MKRTVSYYLLLGFDVLFLAACNAPANVETAANKGNQEAVLDAVDAEINESTTEHEAVDGDEEYNKGIEYVDKEDYTSALPYFFEAAEAGNAKAMAELGRMYVNGWGVEQDYEKALEWTYKAIDQDNADAQATLGFMYSQGYGVELDYKKAAEWYSKAAEQGDAFAQTNLGAMYSLGLGVIQDYEKSVEWYKKAAEQGDSEGQRGLAKAYESGQGVPQDYEKAIELYSKAIDQGNVKAMTDLGHMYDYGVGVDQDIENAKELYLKAAEQGEPVAQRSMGTLYYEGIGVEQDLKKAVEWYTKAAEQKDPVAQYNLGNMYYYGEEVAQDYKKAVELYKEAAEQGYADAQAALAYMYCCGVGVPQDYEQGIKLYTQAAEQGSVEAQYSLGVAYELGEGVPQDNKKAMEWYSKAAEQGHEKAKQKVNGLELPLIDKYLEEARKKAKGSKKGDKDTEPLSSMEFAGVKDGDKGSVDIIYKKLEEAWKSNKIAVPADVEYMYYNPSSKISFYDVNKDGIDEFLLLSEIYGEPQIDVFEPFNLKKSAGFGSTIVPNATGDYYLESECMFIDISGIDSNTYYTITKYDDTGSASFEFRELGDVETGAIISYDVIINGEKTPISKKEFDALQAEAEGCITRCKQF